MVVGSTRVLVRVMMVVCVGGMVVGVIVTALVWVRVLATSIRVLVFTDRMLVRRSGVVRFVGHWVLHVQALRFEAGATATGRTWKAWPNASSTSRST